MKKIIILIITFIPTFVYAQMQEWGWQIVDSASIVCQYRYIRYVTLQDIHGMDDMRLEIGSNLSHYYSYSTLQYDSLRCSPNGPAILRKIRDEIYKEAKGRSKKDFYRIMDKKPGYKSLCHVYKSYTDNKIVTQDHSMDYFQYEEALEPQEWIVYEDTMTILGYSCQKAVCTWRGRNYTAWFSEEIPISEGPYKFHGLPGLIVKIWDDQNHHLWELTGIMSVQNHPIFWSKPPVGLGEEYQPTTRKKFMKEYYSYVRRLLYQLNKDMMEFQKRPVTAKYVREPIEMDFE